MCDLNESPRLTHVLETQSLKSEGDGIWVGPLDIDSFVSSWGWIPLMVLVAL